MLQLVTSLRAEQRKVASLIKTFVRSGQNYTKAEMLAVWQMNDYQHPCPNVRTNEPGLSWAR
jgi:hypothetical protein